MARLREELLKSWVYEEARMSDLAALFDVKRPCRLGTLIDRVRAVETVTVDRPIHTDDDAPLNGEAKFELRSDGSYVFSGHMRATGALSFHYALQPWVNSGGSAVLGAQEVGRVFGSDTPGPRQRGWNEPGSNKGIVRHWRSLRQNRGIGYRLDADMAGVLGGARDVLVFAVEGIALNAVIGVGGWFVLVGNELMGLDADLDSPDILAGIAVGAGTLLVLGPYGLVPALVAGAATVALADVRHRKMVKKERDFADRVFRTKIDYDNVLLTNLSHDNGRKFTIPSLGNKILVNLDDAFDDPVGYMETDPEYGEPGSVFIHELTHAWQIQNHGFLGVLCGIDSNYDYFDPASSRIGDKAWPMRRWKSFNNEQQAHIVDDWYGAHVVRDPVTLKYPLDAQGVPITDLDGPDAIDDPAFPFIRDNIRAGVA